MSEWFYHPVTEWGKEIAEKLTQDNGIRIDVHEVLRKLEPIWINTQEKAFQHERLNKIFSSDDAWFWKHLMDASEKLAEIQRVAEEYNRLSIEDVAWGWMIPPRKILDILGVPEDE